jgi:N-acyl-D-aspartate/D-glutamate deacylase
MLPSVDLLIRGATVLDGTGGPARVTDVAVTGGRIEAVDDLSAEQAGTSVVATGLALAPGFIDVHSHDDFAVFLTPEMDFKLGQGVTTDVVGNCGLGAAPYRPARAYLAFFDADRHRDALPAWDTYDEYLDAVDANPPSLNVAVLVGHGTVRLDAMGNERRAPTDAELGRMLDTLALALDAGCVGYSTGLIYEPGRYSTTGELVALATAMAELGGVYASHMRNESDGLLDAVAETIRIGEESGVPVQISHHKASGRSAWGLVKESLAMIDEARSRHVEVTADQYPYTAGSTSLFAILQNYEEGTAGVGAVDWSNIVLVSAPGNRDWEGHSMADLAETFRVDPVEAAKRVVDAEGYGAVVVIESMNEDDVRTVMAHPTTMIGSDGIPTLGGNPHPRLYGTFARVLGHYVRDERVLSLEEAIHRMTGMPASKFGLSGRGVIQPGAWADLVLFDPVTIDDIATYHVPRRHPTGISWVWVNGTAVLREGKHTGERPGRALRRTQD